MDARANLRRKFSRMAMTLTCGSCGHKWIDRNANIRMNGNVRCSHCGRVDAVDMVKVEKEFVEASMKGLVNKLPLKIGARR